MQELPQSLFDVYALALPRGHGFGDRPPIGAWETADGRAYGSISPNSSSSRGFLLSSSR